MTSETGLSKMFHRDPRQAVETVIEPGKPLERYGRELWRFRELFVILAWRDLAVRYKQTVIGVLWAVLRPLVTMVILTVIFGKIAKMPTPGGIPYSLFVLAAMLPWQFFSTALLETSNSLVGNVSLVSKVYFPRLIVPGSSVIVSLADFLITLILMAILMVSYGFLPDWRVLFLPLLIALAFGAAFGAGLWLCALNVNYRDFRHIVPVILQFGLYVSPVGFSADIIPRQWRLLYALNPMTGVIDGFRWALLHGSSDIYWPGMGLCIAVTAGLMISGLWYFRRAERTFADLI
jgi:lipopolysaccharide transport system permease protein